MPIENITFFRRRSIAGYVPDVVIEERHRDDLQITKHPVESGANITDHAYKEPPVLTMDMMLRSDNGGFFGAIGSALGAVADPIALIGDNPRGNPSDMYKALQELQESREFFTVIAGKRRYENMLLSTLQVTTNEDTENVLSVTCTMENVIVVETRRYELSGENTESVPVYGNNKVRRGNKQLQESEAIDNSTGLIGVPDGSA